MKVYGHVCIIHGNTIGIVLKFRIHLNEVDGIHEINALHSLCKLLKLLSFNHSFA